MKRAWRLSALVLVFAYSLIPFEAKATAATLLTGVDLVFTQSDLYGTGVSRSSTAPRQRACGLERLRVAPPSLPASARRGIPLPAVRKLRLRLPQAPVRALAGHRRYLGRERAPPA